MSKLRYAVGQEFELRVRIVGLATAIDPQPYLVEFVGDAGDSAWVPESTLDRGTQLTQAPKPIAVGDRVTDGEPDGKDSWCGAVIGIHETDAWVLWDVNEHGEKIPRPFTDVMPLDCLVRLDLPLP